VSKRHWADIVHWADIATLIRCNLGSALCLLTSPMSSGQVVCFCCLLWIKITCGVCWSHWSGGKRRTPLFDWNAVSTTSKVCEPVSQSELLLFWLQLSFSKNSTREAAKSSQCLLLPASEASTRAALVLPTSGGLFEKTREGDKGRKTFCREHAREFHVCLLHRTCS